MRCEYLLMKRRMFLMRPPNCERVDQTREQIGFEDADRRIFSDKSAHDEGITLIIL
jgi:hypothetical protein